MSTVKALKQIQDNQAQARVYEKIKARHDTILDFYKSLRDSYQGGISLLQFLKQMRQTTEDKGFADALDVMIHDIDTNARLLSETMTKFPSLFAPEQVAMIRVAEKSGNWTRKRNVNGKEKPGIVDMIIRSIKRRGATYAKVKSGLFYPVVVLCFVILTVAIFSFWLLPVLENFFTQIDGSNSNIFAKRMFQVSGFIQKYWWLTPIVIAIAGIFLWHSWTFGNAKAIWKKYQMRIWGIGPIFRDLYLGDTMWQLGILQDAGLPIQQCLIVAAEAHQSPEISEALLKANKQLDLGMLFSEAMRRSHPIFAGHTFMIISNAEQSGSLDEAMQDYAERIYERAEERMEQATRWIEPILLGVAGTVVGVIVISFYGSIGAAIANLASR